MSAVAHRREIKRLVRLLGSGALVELGAIPWAAPVMMFGRLQSSQVATLGLNPSNLEFVDAKGAALRAPSHRFETLATLGLKCWSDADKGDIERVRAGCELYFTRRPYDTWFKPLDRVISGLGVSYYDSFTPACHLDLVPFATALKWSGLDQATKVGLLDIGAQTLVRAIGNSGVRVLVLNGATVVRTFQDFLGEPLESTKMPSWRLGREGSSPVEGFAYRGVVSQLAGEDLGRELLVLGYNHNIQSSYGVTREVVASIKDWVAGQGRGVLQ